MLRAMSGLAAPVTPAGSTVTKTAHAVWLDLNNPSEAERAEAARLTGLRVPDLAEIAEIETSSRLINEHGALRLSTPMLSRNADGTLSAAPIGFVVTPDRLLTLRYAGSIVFDRFAEEWRWETGPGIVSGVEPFLGLLEAIVDRLADVLERIGAETDALSAEVFASGAQNARSSRKRDAFLQSTLADIGVKGARISQLRDGLLGVGRIVRFVPETAASWLDESQRRRFLTLERDIVSLSDYDAQLTSKVQFLLDATLGFINIEQTTRLRS